MVSTKPLNTQYTEGTIRWILALCFLTAGVIKLSDLESFKQSVVITYMGSWGHHLSLLIAHIIPILEVLLGYLLIEKRKETAGPILSVLLCLSFTLWITIGVMSGNMESCGCFGRWDPLASYPYLALARAIGLLAISIVLLKITAKNGNK